MVRFFASFLALVALLVTSRLARADEPVKAKGLVVVATDGTTDAAWPLARAVYGSDLLRPRDIDDARARVLAGEAVPSPQAGTPGPNDELKELAELRAGIKGDDAASRQLLGAMAEKLHVVGVVVVFATEARLYDAETKGFDAARYAGEKDEWKSAVRSLERWYLPTPPPIVTMVPKEPEPTKPPTKSKAFYETAWFWAAIGAALLIGGGVLIATSVQTSDTIHMHLRLP